jgi:hypothetical protein
MTDFAARLNARIKERAGEPAAVPNLEVQADELSTARGETTASFTQQLEARQRLRKQGIHSSSHDQVSSELRDQMIVGEINKAGGQETELGEAGSIGFLDRADLSLSDTFQEKKVKFMDKYPEGDFIQVPAPSLGAQATDAKPQNTVLFRRNKYEPFAELDAGIMDKFELIGDIADIAGDVPAIAAEIFMTRGAGLVTQALGAAAGTIVGDSAKEAIEALRGFREETLGQTVERIGTRAALGGFGAVATAPISGAVNVGRGRAILKLKPGAEDAQAAAAALEIPDLLWSQVGSNPIIKRLQAQTEATTSKISDYIRVQQERAVAALSSLREREALEFVAGGVETLRNMHKDAITRLKAKIEGVDDIASTTKTPGVDMSRGGLSLQAEVNDYVTRSSLLVDRSYTLAREKGTPEFDISPLKAAANEVESVVLARGKAVERKMSILGPDGVPLTILQHEKVPLQKVHPQVQEQIDLIKRLDPTLPTVKTADGTPVDATEQLRAVRSNLWKLKQTSINADPEERARAEQASTLYSVITRVLQNPKNADTEFVAAWANANKMAADRFSTLEKLVVVKAANTETPAQLAKRLAAPYQVDNLRTLKSAIPADNFRLFQRAVISDLIADNNIDQLSRRLAQFDRETLNELIPLGTQRRLAAIGLGVDRLKHAGIEDAVKSQETFAGAINQLLQNNDDAGLKTFVSMVTAREPTDKVRRTARATIMEKIFSSAVKQTDQGAVVDGKQLMAVVKQLEEKGLNKILTADDRSMLGHLTTLAPYMKVKSDAGTDLVAAGLVGQLREYSSDAVMSLVHLMGIGRLMTNRRVQRMLLGSGTKEKWSPAKLRVFGAIVAQETLDTEAEAGQ